MDVNSLLENSLKKYFPNIVDFRLGQKQILSEVVNRSNVLAIMPTGSGKSLCYQLPAMIFRKDWQEGITIVISPLIALMKDQVNHLKELDISVEYLNSSLSTNEKDRVLKKIYQNGVDLLFVAPERLRDGLFIATLEQAKTKISFCVIDEAHCISEWGHDFRIDYLYIPEFLNRFGNPQVLALTATASKPVKEEIVQSLKIRKVFDSLPVYRSNQQLNVLYTTREEKEEELLSLLSNLKKPGIIYTTGRDKAEYLSEFLKEKGYKSDFYHANRKQNEKDKVFNRFINDDLDILCATKAFGMGIDKENIRFIIHYQIPESLDSYLQEIGRGGRDSLLCKCFLLYDSKDIAIHKRFISDAYPAKEKIKEIYSETLYLGPRRRGKDSDLRSIPFEQFYDEKAAIFLKHFEDQGLISRQGEILESLKIELIEEIDDPVYIALQNMIDTNIQEEVSLSEIANILSSDVMEILLHIYQLVVQGNIKIGTRQFRSIQYKKLKGDISKEDIDEISFIIEQRRQFKLDRLHKMVEFVENGKECRARKISSYFNKEMNEDCGICDNCLRKREKGDPSGNLTNLDILFQIEELERKVDFLEGDLSRAYQYCSNDPKASLNKLRLILEKLLRKLYSLEMNRKAPEKAMIGELMRDKIFYSKLDEPSRTQITFIQKMGNQGSHYNERVDNLLTTEHAFSTLLTAVNILKWYYDKYVDHTKVNS